MKLTAGLAAAVAVCVAGSAVAAQPAFDTFIAHRGESHDAPENTLPAYRMAVERGFGFECDVYLSADKRVFTFHDGNLTRTTAGACTKDCAAANWETEISKVDVGGWGKWKGSKYSPTRPALLEELLQLAVDGRQIYVEVKPGPEIVPYIRRIFAKQTKATPKNTLFISFNKESCKALKEQMPEYKVFWLTLSARGPRNRPVGISAQEVIAALKETKADGVDCHFDPKYITAAFIKEIRDAGYEFHVWTVDDLKTSLLAFERGAQTVTTNCAKKQLDEYNARK
ncbi:MAG: glycerophosphodiester phosphodiesterase family protein [Kiritimatiellia bacterium]